MDEQPQPQNYFTPEVEAKISGLSDREMLTLLKNLEQTEYWPAILRYNQQRLQQSQSAVFVADPVKEPTQIARHQGIMIGLSDMQNAVITLVQDAAQENKEAEEENEDVKQAKD